MSTIQTTRPRVKARPARREFGAGLGERYPVYTAPASFEDQAWWEAQAEREEEIMLARRFAEYEAQSRLENGYEPY